MTNITSPHVFTPPQRDKLEGLSPSAGGDPDSEEAHGGKNGRY